MFAFQDRRGPVEVAFTDRHGGVSTGEFSSLNLAGPGGDGAADLAENHRRAAQAFTGGTSAAVRRMHQVHGFTVAVVTGQTDDRPGDAAPVADGLVTAEAGTVLMVSVADCLPLLLADVGNGVVGAAHAGRPGMVAGVVGETVRRMRDLGARDVVAWVGPHVCGRCYEVPAQMREEVAAVVPAAHTTTSWQTPALDIGAGVRAQLTDAGVEVVGGVGRCTIEDDDLFSYRRQGAASGRLAGMVWIRP